MELITEKIDFPENCNIIFGMSHFIKTVEDLYEILINSFPGFVRGSWCFSVVHAIPFRRQGCIPRGWRGRHRPGRCLRAGRCQPGSSWCKGKQFLT